MAKRSPKQKHPAPEKIGAGCFLLDCARGLWPLESRSPDGYTRVVDIPLGNFAQQIIRCVSSWRVMRSRRAKWAGSS